MGGGLRKRGIEGEEVKVKKFGGPRIRPRPFVFWGAERRGRKRTEERERKRFNAEGAEEEARRARRRCGMGWLVVSGSRGASERAARRHYGMGWLAVDGAWEVRETASRRVGRDCG